MYREIWNSVLWNASFDKRRKLPIQVLYCIKITKYNNNFIKIYNQIYYLTKIAKVSEGLINYWNFAVAAISELKSMLKESTQRTFFDRVFPEFCFDSNEYNKEI